MLTLWRSKAVRTVKDAAQVRSSLELKKIMGRGPGERRSVEYGRGPGEQRSVAYGRGPKGGHHTHCACARRALPEDPLAVQGSQSCQRRLRAKDVAIFFMPRNPPPIELLVPLHLLLVLRRWNPF